MIGPEQTLVSQSVEQDPFEELAVQFQSAASNYEAWPAEICAKNFSKLCARAGSAVFPLVKDRRLRLPDLPEWLLTERVGSDDPRAQFEHDALWWLALVGWLDRSEQPDAASTSRVSYAREVFHMWRPNVGFYKYPYLAFHPGLCKEYGSAACIESSSAIRALSRQRRIAPRAAEAQSKHLKARFVSSRNSDLYHHSTCSAVRLISSDNMIEHDDAPKDKQMHKGCPAR